MPVIPADEVKSDCCEQKKPGREKYWSELDDKEKIARMRQQVKNQQLEITRLETLVRQLMDHRHLNDQLVISINNVNSRGSIIGGPRGTGTDDVYF